MAMDKSAQLMAEKVSGACQTSQFISAMRHCSSVGIASSSAQWKKTLYGRCINTNSGQ